MDCEPDSETESIDEILSDSDVELDLVGIGVLLFEPLLDTEVLVEGDALVETLVEALEDSEVDTLLDCDRDSVVESEAVGDVVWSIVVEWVADTD